MGTKKIFIILLVSVVAAVIVASYFYFKDSFSPNRNKYETVTVERGEVVSSTLATGVVDSENEVLMLSPAASIIKTIYKEPGNQVKVGEIILQLQTKPIEDDISKLNDQLEVKRNNLEKNQLNSQSTKLDLDYSEEVKLLKIVSLKSQLSDQQQLLEVGGISPARVEETKQEITLAEKELAMLKEKNAIRVQQLASEEKGLLLQIAIDEKMILEKQQLLSKMSIRAPSSGIILNISGQVGEKVQADKMLVQMSDLSSFKVIGSVDEEKAHHIKTGASVLVNVEGEQLEGTIGSITPMVENNKVQFNVHLAQSSHPKLIANQNVQIQIIQYKTENALRIKKLPGFETGGQQTVFVVNGDVAVKKEITLGIVGDPWCEVLSGLNAGDLVIAGDTNNFKHLKEFEIHK